MGSYYPRCVTGGISKMGWREMGCCVQEAPIMVGFECFRLKADYA
jgi:hypothetical protein